MFDFGHLPRGADVQIYQGGAVVGGSDGRNWRVWNKPRGASIVQALVIGPGAGGSGGKPGAAANAGGGGGGGSAGQVSILVPAFFLPDMLFVETGCGGKGGGEDDVGAVPPLLSRIVLAPSLAPPQASIIAQSGFASGGAPGSILVGGVGGLGGQGSARFAPGLKNIIDGQTGAAGGFNAGGNNINPIPDGTGLVTTAGAGGAGLGSTVGFDGGGQLGGGGNELFFHYCLGGAGASSSTTDGLNGSNGLSWASGMAFFYGGAGGGSGHPLGVTSNGANGGVGGYGCGGGGGGACLTGQTPGRGGDGGPGLVIIISW